MTHNSKEPSVRTVIIVMALLMASAMHTHAADPQNLQQQIDALAKPLIADKTAVGFVVGVLQDGKAQFWGYGETVKGSQITPDADTVYEIASVTKVFTCTLLADMVERGLMKLDDPVQQYLPAGVKMPVTDNRSIRLVDLATHSSGLPRMPNNIMPSNPQNPYTDERMFAFLNGYHLRRTPGVYEYSNLGAGLLGVILARHARCTYEQLLNERIFQPLGLTDTRITLDDRLQRRLAPPYNEALEPLEPDFKPMPAAGALHSTARDLLKFVQANLAANRADGADGPLDKAFRLALSKHRDAGNNGPAMGLGWRFDLDGVTCFHGGLTKGYRSWLIMVPDREISVVVLANTRSTRIKRLCELVAQAAQGMDVQPLSPKKPSPKRR